MKQMEQFSPVLTRCYFVILPVHLCLHSLPYCFCRIILRSHLYLIRTVCLEHAQLCIPIEFRFLSRCYQKSAGNLILLVRVSRLLMQTCQVSRIERETHAFEADLTLTRTRTEISRILSMKDIKILF